MQKLRQDEVLKFSHEAMNTIFELVIAGQNKTYASQVSKAVFSEVDRLERLFNRFDSSSEISRINRLAPAEAMMIGVETADLLALSSAIQQQTDGAFDINWNAWQKTNSRIKCNNKPVNLSELVKISRAGGFFKIQRKSKFKAKGYLPPLNLDLGGVGKGYALDCVVPILKDWGVSNALLHAGTSTVLGLGPGPGKVKGKTGWPVRISFSKRGLKFEKTVFLKERALSGSGAEVKGCHIFDPVRRVPGRQKIMTWVSHPSAAIADALSTAFFVMNLNQIKSFCRRWPELWAVVITLKKKCKIFNAGNIE